MPEEDDDLFPSTTNSLALEQTIEALEGLKPEHAALVKHARTLARELDNPDGSSDLKLHTEYRHVLSDLLVAGQAEELDAYALLMKDIASAANA